MAKKYDEKDGVWRTIRGRKVFIREGQTAAEAIAEQKKKQEERPAAKKLAKQKRENKESIEKKKNNEQIEKELPDFVKNATPEEQQNYIENMERINEMKSMGQEAYLLKKQRERGIKNDEKPSDLQDKANEVVEGMGKANYKKESIEKRRSNEQIEKDFPDNLSDEVKEQARLLNTRGYDDIDDVIDDFAEEQGITRREAKYALLKDEFKQRQSAYMDAKTSGAFVLSKTEQKEYDRQRKGQDWTYGMTPEEWKKAEEEHKDKLNSIDKDYSTKMEEIMHEHYKKKTDDWSYKKKKLAAYGEWKANYNKELARRNPDLMEQKLKEEEFSEQVKEAIQSGINESPFRKTKTDEYETYKRVRLHGIEKENMSYEDFNNLDKKYIERFGKEPIRAVQYRDGYAVIQNGGIHKTFKTPEAAQKYADKLKTNGEVERPVAAKLAEQRKKDAAEGRNITKTKQKAEKKWLTNSKEDNKIMQRAKRLQNEFDWASEPLSRKKFEEYRNITDKYDIPDMTDNGGPFIKSLEDITYEEYVEIHFPSYKKVLDELMERGYSRTTAEKMLRQRKRK